MCMPADYGAVPAACALNGSRFMGREIAVATSTPLNKDTGAGTGQCDTRFYFAHASLVQGLSAEPYSHLCDEGLAEEPCARLLLLPLLPAVRAMQSCL
jgi:hypothetical protein